MPAHTDSHIGIRNSPDQSVCNRTPCPLMASLEIFADRTHSQIHIFSSSTVYHALCEIVSRLTQIARLIAIKIMIYDSTHNVTALLKGR